MKVYVSKESKKEETKSTAYSFLLVSVFGFIALILFATGVLPVHVADYMKIMLCIVMGVMLLIFFVIGIVSLRQLKTLGTQAEKENAKWVPVSAEIEQEVSELEEEEAKAFLTDLGETEPGLNRLIRTAYAMLGLINFFTVGEDECRAWTVHSGTKAPTAAGKIHSDIERGFIRAEIITYDELIKCGSFAAAREKGLLRVEGKEYIIKDGDIAYFRFNV